MMAQTRRISADDWTIIATALGGDVAENLKAAILQWDMPDKHGDNMRLARALRAVHQKIEAGIKYYRKTVHENRADPPRHRQTIDDGVGYTWIPEVPPTDHICCRHSRRHGICATKRLARFVSDAGG